MNRAGLVLAGGRSTRMGRDKASLELDGAALLSRVLHALGGVVSERAVVCRRTQELPALPDDVVRVHDDVEDQGPLGGLGPGLAALKSPVAFVTGCDAPLLPRPVVSLLFDQLGDADVAVARAQGRLHPLCAVYRTALADRIAQRLAEGLRRPVDLYGEVRTVHVEEALLRQVDPELLCLRNANTPEDLEAVRRCMGPRVTLELFEGARRLAGCATLQVRAATLGRALDELALHLPALEGRVVRAGRLAEHWRASLGGSRWIADPATPLAQGDAVVLVSALAGG